MSSQNVDSQCGGVMVLTPGLERRVLGDSDMAVVTGEGLPFAGKLSGYARKTLACEQWAFEKWPVYDQKPARNSYNVSPAPAVFHRPGRVPVVGGLAEVRVHTSAYTAHTVAKAGKTLVYREIQI